MDLIIMIEEKKQARKIVCNWLHLTYLLLDDDHFMIYLGLYFHWDKISFPGTCLHLEMMMWSLKL